ncbi:MAG: pilin [Candidatus Berkelbacteria bacterium]|nr:pilin [Candidatus Berkelbacteria bacterium]
MAIDIQQLVTQVTGNSQVNPGSIGTTHGIGIDPTKVTNPETVYYNVIRVFVWGISIIAVLVLVYAGIQYVTAGGDQEKAETAKKTIVGAIIGLLLVIGAYTIFNTTLKVLNKANTSEDVNQIMQESPNTP